ncbi:Protein of unknown function [Gryllus bimaculatus]|nr:Protein of unknown function [Gryllus bimaculatus]
MLYPAAPPCTPLLPAALRCFLLLPAAPADFRCTALLTAVPRSLQEHFESCGEDVRKERS